MLLALSKTGLAFALLVVISVLGSRAFAADTSNISLLALPCGSGGGGDPLLLLGAADGTGKSVIVPLTATARGNDMVDNLEFKTAPGAYSATYSRNGCNATFPLVVINGLHRHVTIAPASNMAYTGSGAVGTLSGRLPLPGLAAQVLYCVNDCEWAGNFIPTPTVVDGGAFYATGLPSGKWILRLTMGFPMVAINIPITPDASRPIRFSQIIRNVTLSDLTTLAN